MLNLPGLPARAAVAPTVRGRGLPVPPEPVIPPEGIAPVTDPASTGTAADASPTTMVLQYLKSRGYQPTSENVRRALEANARDPGVIPGLRSDRPATEAEDQAAMAAARGSGGGGGRPLPVPPIPPEGGDQKTSASPPAADAADSSAGADAAKIAALVLSGGLGMGALGYGAYRAADRFNPEIGRPAVGGNVAPPVDPGAGVAGLPPPPPVVAPPPEAQVTPLDTAMNRAVPQTPADLNPVARPGSLDMTPPRGPVEPVAPVVPFTPREGGAPRVAPTEPLPIRTSPNLRIVPPRVRAPLRLR